MCDVCDCDVYDGDVNDGGTVGRADCTPTCSYTWLRDGDVCDVCDCDVYDGDVNDGGTVDRADCTPACTYTWLKDGQRLLDSQGIRLGTVGSSSSGTYTCRASNGEDSSEVSFVLDVQCESRAEAGGGGA